MEAIRRIGFYAKYDARTLLRSYVKPSYRRDGFETMRFMGIHNTGNVNLRTVIEGIYDGELYIKMLKSRYLI